MPIALHALMDTAGHTLDTCVGKAVRMNFFQGRGGKIMYNRGEKGKASEEGGGCGRELRELLHI